MKSFQWEKFYCPENCSKIVVHLSLLHGIRAYWSVPNSCWFLRYNKKSKSDFKKLNISLEGPLL